MSNVNTQNLKKVFITFPHGIVSEDEEIGYIKKMQRLAEVLEGEILELIPIKMTNDSNDIFKLGLKIEALSKADVFVGFTDTWNMPELYILNSVASDYGIKKYFIDIRWFGKEFENAVENYRNRPYPVCDNIQKD